VITRILPIGALLAVPVLARAQVERLSGRLPEPTRAEVAAVVDSARAAGLPADPLVNRALEGASKGADGARILAAVRALAARIGAARTALGAAATEAELVAGAAALRAGATPAFLSRLRRESPREALVVPLAVMADLVSRGVPADTAATSVLALVRSGARDADLVAFRQSVERDIALGAAGGAAAAVRLSSGGQVSTGDATRAGEIGAAGSPGGPTPPPTTPRKP
jgi:hypothetical protein